MPYGRLADPNCTLGTDPRSDPRMVKAFAQFGLDGPAPAIPLTVDSSLEDRRAFAAMNEEGIGAIFEIFANGVPAVEGIATTTVIITGGDGNDGGMAISSAADTGYLNLREYLAATGLVVVGVEFRNSGGKLGPHPFPAGLDDCAAAIQWVSTSRGELGVTNLIVSGESGGGNLTLTVAHKAKREGWLHEINGSMRSARSSRTAGSTIVTTCRRSRRTTGTS